MNAPITSESLINSRESRTLQYTTTALPFYKYCAEMNTGPCDVMLYQRFPTFLTRGALFRINFYGGAP